MRRLPGHMHLMILNSLRHHPSGRFEREMLKPKRWFVQFNIILSWSGAKREEGIQLSLFVHFCLPFLWRHIHAEPETPKTRESEWNEHFVKSARLQEDYIVEYYSFTGSLTVIIKSPHFKRWKRVCVNNQLLICFFIHDFVIWCILLSYVLILYQSSRGSDLQ